MVVMGFVGKGKGSDGCRWVLWWMLLGVGTVQMIHIHRSYMKGNGYRSNDTSLKMYGIDPYFYDTHIGYFYDTHTGYFYDAHRVGKGRNLILSNYWSIFLRCNKIHESTY